MYQVKILRNKEFEEAARSNPRYANVDEDNLGFADPVTNTAYVRLTAYPELNKYLVDHEFNHLIEDHGTDEDEYGIRHKKKRGFGRFLQTFFNPINLPGLGPLSKDDRGILNTDNQSSTRSPEAQAKAQEESFQNTFGSALSSFGPQIGASASGRLPDSVQGGSVGGGLNPQGGLNAPAQPAQNIDPELQKRLAGFFSGRVSF